MKRKGQNILNKSSKTRISFNEHQLNSDPLKVDLLHDIGAKRRLCDGPNSFHYLDTLKLAAWLWTMYKFH